MMALCLPFMRNRPGITGTGEDRLIVSLTSYAARFKTLHFTLETLLRQTKKPDRILVWIAKDEISLLSERSRRMDRRGVEFLACDDLRSYKKIVFCLQRFPEATVVTADDDVFYPRDWLNSLYLEHLKVPEQVLCHRARLMTFDENGRLNPYRFWPNLQERYESALVLPIGVGGVLYPAGCFHEDVLRSDIFMEVAPYADDLWLKTMTYMAGTTSKCLYSYKKKFKEVKASQSSSLKAINVRLGNDEQKNNIFSKYKIFSY